jgi:adenylate kinase
LLIMISIVQPKQENRPSSILLVGPTGSGKTPLGQLLEKRGLWRLPCLHFDFGQELRLSAREGSHVLASQEKEIVTRLLQTNSLLEDTHFDIARKLLDDFIHRKYYDRRTLIVLNGLPRHEGQARQIEEYVGVISVVSLECTQETVMLRIAVDAGGDRAGRVDDSFAEVRNKLQIFKRSTIPLLDYYRRRHVGIIHIEVSPATSAANILSSLEKTPAGS